MGINRRDAMRTAGVAGVGGLVGGGVAGYFAGQFLDGHREAVAGFEWNDDRFPPFDDDELRKTAPLFSGDTSIGLGHPKHSPTVAIIGANALALATDMAAKSPYARLGLIYTDPGGHWHQGMGEPQQQFGGIVPQGEDILVAAALGIGKNDVQMTWAVRANGMTVPLPSQTLDVIPREQLEERYPGVPAL